MATNNSDRVSEKADHPRLRPDYKIGIYHLASAIPPAYAAARDQRQTFRLADPDAVRRYISDLRAADRT